jgi:hypothetical protein
VGMVKTWQAIVSRHVSINRKFFEQSFLMILTLSLGQKNKADNQFDLVANDVK